MSTEPVNSNSELRLCLRWALVPINVRNYGDTERFANGGGCEDKLKDTSQSVGARYREASSRKCLADILELGIVRQRLQLR